MQDVSEKAANNNATDKKVILFIMIILRLV